MRTAIAASILAACWVPWAGAQALEGREIRLVAGNQTSYDVPLALPYPHEAPAGKVWVVEDKTGKRFPVTIRNGEFVFVPEGALPLTEHSYTVHVNAESQAAPIVRVEKRDGEDVIDVHIHDQHFTSYHYSREEPKPFLWPVLSEDGVPVTRGWPMEEADGDERTDHIHHRSMWTAHGDVNGHDFWSQGSNAGQQYTDDVAFGSGDAYGWILAKNTWKAKDGTPVVREEREYRFYASPAGARLFDTRVTFTPIDGDVVFGDTKEGGIFSYRVWHEMNASGEGIITTSDGKVGEGDAWGQPAAWCDYSAKLAEAGWRGITVMDHPGNLRHPTRWHVRDYGLNGANPFGISYFTETRGTDQEIRGDYTLKATEQLTFNYRCLIHTGSLRLANVPDRFADYATPPQVQWVGETVASAD